MHADRDLLFGLLALQNGLVSRERLVAAAANWLSDRSRGLAEHMVARADLDETQRSALEALVSLHLARDGGDATASIASIPLGRSTAEALVGLGDTDVTRTLARAGTAELDATGSYDSGGGRDGAHAVGTETEGDRRFRVLRPHARGGLGAVFVALDAELNREVALKQILDHHADDPGSRQRFLLEAEITGGLEHPGIVPVYGLGAYRDGRPYYAMRFIRGDSLKEAIDRYHAPGAAADPGRALAFRQLLRRFTDVCNAIEYAHSRGVLHRDIKPGNVIVGKHGETLVVDWGLAKAGKGAEGPDEERPIHPSSSGGSSETLPGQAMGTPAYMSPEQARGDLDALGPRSDVYSLGATLYSLLTGRVPYQGLALAELMRVLQAAGPTPPRRIDPSIDPPLEAICRKAMATRPEDRYGSARELAEDIDRWLADEPVSAYPEPWTRTLLRWLSRHRTAVTAAAAAGLVALVGLGAVAAVQTRGRAALERKNSELSVANERIREANTALGRANREISGARDLAEGRLGVALRAIGTFREVVGDHLAAAAGAESRPLRTALLQAPMAFYRQLRDDLEKAGDERPESRLRLAEAYLNLGSLAQDVGSRADAEAGLAHAVAILDGLREGAPADLRPRVLGALAQAHGRLGELRSTGMNPAEALAELDLAREADREGLRLDPRASDARVRLAASQVARAQVHQPAGDAEAAIEALAEAVRVLDEGLALDPDSDPMLTFKARALARIGLTEAYRDGRHAAAREACDRARAAIGPVLERSPGDLVARSVMSEVESTSALLHQLRGEFAEAARDAGRRVELVEGVVRERPAASRSRSLLVQARRQAAMYLDRVGRGEEADRMIQAAREAAEALVRDEPGSSTFLDTLGSVWQTIGVRQYSAGRLADAIASMNQSAAIHERLLAADPARASSRRELAGMYYNLGVLNNQAGKNAEARAAYGRSLAQREQLVAEAPGNPQYRLDLAAVLGNLATIDIQEVHLARAADQLERALGVLEELRRANPENAEYRSYATRSRSNLGATLSRMGRYERAAALLRGVLDASRALADAQPQVLQYRIDAATSAFSLALVRLATGRDAEAADLLSRARDEIASIARPGEVNPAVAKRQAEICVRLSHLGGQDPAGVLAGLDAALTLCESVLARNTDNPTLREPVRELLRARARVQAGLGRAGPARADLDRAEALADPPDRVSAEALLAAWSGDTAAALPLLADAANRPGLSSSGLSRLADAASTASGLAARDERLAPAERARLADEAGALAVLLIRRADALGGTPGEDAVYLLDVNRLLDPLRGRDDFRLLKEDRAMPGLPFADPG